MPFTITAGAAVDSFIEKLVPLLEKGDIIIDGGNSEYQDTQRRYVGSLDLCVTWLMFLFII